MLEDGNLKGRFLLLYGSATGQSQAIAEGIAENCPKFGLKANLLCLDEVEKKFQVEKETCMVIVVSTTGDGNPPENAEKFVRKIKRKTLPPDFLQNLNYTILGLGDTNYSNFCRCARDIDKRLEQLGAKRFYPTGLADDGVGLEIVADPWLEGLYPVLQMLLNVTQESQVSLCEKVKPVERTISENPSCKADCNRNSDSLTDSLDTINLSKDKLRTSAMSANVNDDESATESNSDPVDSTLSSFKNLNIDIIKKKHSAYDLQHETPCFLISQTSFSTKLTECDNALAENELTVPLLPPPYLSITFLNENFETVTMEHQNGCKLPVAASDILHVGISSVKVLTAPESVKKTLLLELDTKGLSLSFTPGSTIAIICANNSSEVDLLFKRLQLTEIADKKAVLSVIANTAKRRASVPPHIPPTSTLRHIFTTCLDIREPPSKAFIRTLINYTTNANEVRRLQELCSKEGAALYTEHIRECRISLLDILYAFPSCNPPVERLLEHLPRLQPRPYSVCSYPEYKENVIDVVFNVIEIQGDPTKGNFYSRRGICAGWLDDITKPQLQCGNNREQIRIPIYLRTSQYFVPPEDLFKPIILIGPGTGVAPFVGFLQQRYIKRKKLSNCELYGETWLFFGCRNKEKDFLFREELIEFESNGTLTKLNVTFFKRHSISPSEHVIRYVQEKLRIMATEISRLIVDHDAVVYVCGDAKIWPKDVNNAFLDILQQTKDGNLKGRFLLVYGSATGQSQAIAEGIAENCPKFGLKANLLCLDEVEKKFQVEKETCMVIVVSTTGDGNPPENAEKFVRKIKRKTLPPDFLQNLNYTILGLGDTNYSNFCRCAKDIDKRLEQLGAKRFYPTGLADDGVGLEIVADPWLEGLYPVLQKLLNVTQESQVSLCEKVKPLERTISENPSCKPDCNRNSDSLTDSVDTMNLSKDKLSTSAMTANVNDDEIATESNLDSVDSTLSSFKNLNIDIIKKKHSAYDLQHETPCFLISQTSFLTKLTECDNALAENELTVPLLPPPYLNITFLNENFETVTMEHQNGCKLPVAASDILHVGVSSVKILTAPESVKKTLLLELDTKGLSLSFTPGSTIAIVCANNSSEVDLFFKRLQLTEIADKKAVLSVIANTAKRRASVPPHIPPTSTLRHIFTTCLDIREPPSKAFIRTLINYTTNANEVRRLQQLCSKEGAALYTEHIRECRISLLDILYAFPSCNPPVERLLEHLPRLQPRPYSVCSYPEYKENVIDVVFNVIEIQGDPTKGNFYSRRGICTGWLDDITKPLQCGNNREQIRIPIYLRTSQYFLPPEDLSKPIIMIGPGTGVAPFVGFLQQRYIKRQKLSNGELYGETWLFFGCRNKEKDFLFREELIEFESNGTLTKLNVTFSRDIPSPPSEHVARYVQEKLRIMATEISRLIVDHDAVVYVCGDAKNMAKDVNNAFLDILQQTKGMSTDDANLFIMKKRINKTYLEDVWA
ncbi:hypothetical protein Btru_045236 [Bulinus truncatus]|nr:hypothetical protein Btru_045236 [Bulinus truncatus]